MTRATRPLLVLRIAVTITTAASTSITAHEAAAANTAAEAPMVALSYSADAAGCFSETAFREAVRARLSFDPFAPVGGAKPILMTTRIVRTGSQLRATVVLTEPDRPSEVAQEISAGLDGCATLSVAAALAASMAIERTIARRHAMEVPPSAPPPEPERRLAPAVSAPESRRRSRPRRKAPVEPRARSRSIGIETYAGPIFGLGILPGVSAGASFGGSLELGRFRPGLEAGAWLPSTVGSSHGGGARAWIVFLSGTACIQDKHLFACGLATVGDFRAAGANLFVSRSSGSTYVALGGRVGIELPLVSPFSLAFQATAVVPLVRRTLRIMNEALWQAPPVGGELGVSLRVTIL